MHLGFNAVWLLAFASPVARRFGTRRFLLFFAATIAGGALAYLLACRCAGADDRRVGRHFRHDGAPPPGLPSSRAVRLICGTRSRQRRSGSGCAAPCCTAQSTRPDICRCVVRSQPAVRARFRVVSGRRKPECGLGSACRRLSRRPFAVLTVRSGASGAGGRKTSARCIDRYRSLTLCRMAAPNSRIHDRNPDPPRGLSRYRRGVPRDLRVEDEKAGRRDGISEGATP